MSSVSFFIPGESSLILLFFFLLLLLVFDHFFLCVCSELQPKVVERHFHDLLQRYGGTIALDLTDKVRLFSVLSTHALIYGPVWSSGDYCNIFASNFVFKHSKTLFSFASSDAARLIKCLDNFQLLIIHITGFICFNLLTKGYLLCQNCSTEQKAS